MDLRRAASFSLDARLLQPLSFSASKIESSWIRGSISTAGDLECGKRIATWFTIRTAIFEGNSRQLASIQQDFPGIFSGEYHRVTAIVTVQPGRMLPWSLPPLKRKQLPPKN